MSRLIVLLCAALLCKAALAAENETATHNKHEFSYTVGSVDPPGPDRWYTVYDLEAKVDWTQCSGKDQSPINIAGAKPSNHASMLQLEVLADGCEPSKLVADEEHMSWRVEEVGKCKDNKTSSVTFQGTTYNVKQFHFHSPSEHTFGGGYFDAEMHVVHQSEDGKYLVIGVMLSTSVAFSNNTLIGQFWDSFLQEKGNETVAMNETLLQTETKSNETSVSASQNETLSQTETKDNETSASTSFNETLSDSEAQSNETNVSASLNETESKAENSSQSARHINPYDIVFSATNSFYHYNGSLTTPGCNEGKSSSLLLSLCRCVFLLAVLFASCVWCGV